MHRPYFGMHLYTENHSGLSLCTSEPLKMAEQCALPHSTRIHVSGCFRRVSLQADQKATMALAARTQAVDDGLSCNVSYRTAVAHYFHAASAASFVTQTDLHL